MDDGAGQQGHEAGQRGAGRPWRSAPNVVCAQGGRTLHGDEREQLHEMVLDHVSDDAELVKVAAAALRPNLLLRTQWCP